MSSVLVVTTSYPAHGGDAAGHFVAAEAQLLARTHEVIVIAPGARARSEDNPRVLGVPDAGLFGFPGALAKLQRNPLLARGAAGFVWSARRELARLPRFDRVLAHWIVPSAWPVAGASGSAAREDFEVVAHGSDVRLLLAFPGALRRRVLESLLGSGAHFRFVSHELRDALCERGPAELARRSRVEPSPLDMSGAPARDVARARLALAEHTRVILVVARLVSGKRVDVALRAACLVRGARVIVIGDGPLRAALEREFSAAQFLGTLPRPAALAWIAAADVLVSSSRHEGAPTVVREARALGVPVVACAAGDLRAWASRDPGIRIVD